MTIGSEQEGQHPGSLTLALVNSVDWRFDPNNRRDKLASYAELLELCASNDSRFRDEPSSSRPSIREELLESARKDPRLSAQAFAAALAFREELFAVLRAAAMGVEPPAEALSAVDSVLRSARLTEALAWSTSVFSLEPRLPEESFDAPLRAIARDAEKLLLSPLMSRIRLCAAPECGWVFLDLSKSGKRRWCEMRSCGNREKARRHRERAALARPGSSRPRDGSGFPLDE